MAVSHTAVSHATIPECQFHLHTKVIFEENGFLQIIESSRLWARNKADVNLQCEKFRTDVGLFGVPSSQVLLY